MEFWTHPATGDERARARTLLHISAVEPPAIHNLDTRPSTVRATISDRYGWKGLLYGTILFPWGMIASVVTTVTWSLSVGLPTFALYGWVIPDTAGGSPYRFTDDYVLTGWGRIGYTFGLTALGVALLAAAPRIIAGHVTVDRQLIARLLDGGPQSARH